MAKQDELIEATKGLLMPNYGPPLLAVARGAGSRLWDADGKEYIDFFAGFGAGGAVGHCHPAVVSAVKAQAETLLSHGNFFTSAPQVELARRITEHAFGGKVFFCHSGAEANEAALKLARLAGGEGRRQLVSFSNCFHGRTMGGLSLTPGKQAGFEPMLPECLTNVAYDDLDAASLAIDDQTAGVFVEPVQGEGGVNLPSKRFMQGLRALCDERGALLICDEVWTAPARTGKWFAYQHYGIEPDVMTLAKAVGGGAPVGACVAAPKWADVLAPGKHGCTMGGNPLCASGGAAAMRVIEEEGLVDRAARTGDGIAAAIGEAGIGCVKAVRHLGMMIGIELDTASKPVFVEAMRRGLLVCIAQANVVRLAPPLNTSDDVIDRGVGMLLDVLKGL